MRSSCNVLHLPQFDGAAVRHPVPRCRKPCLISSGSVAEGKQPGEGEEKSARAEGRGPTTTGTSASPQNHQPATSEGQAARNVRSAGTFGTRPVTERGSVQFGGERLNSRLWSVSSRSRRAHDAGPWRPCAARQQTSTLARSPAENAAGLPNAVAGRGDILLERDYLIRGNRIGDPFDADRSLALRNGSRPSRARTSRRRSAPHLGGASCSSREARFTAPPTMV